MYIERDLEVQLKRYLDAKEIIAVVGPRQCGKTTLIQNILASLKYQKKINTVSFDDVKLLLLFEKDIDTFCDMHVKGYDLLFIDEVQYSKDSGKKLKYIYDKYPIKILITGSSSSELSFHSLKYLVGRIFIFTLYTFSFREFLKSKSDSLLEIYDKAKYLPDAVPELNKYLREFIQYGGYPRVVLANSTEEKKIILKNILNTYLLREIKEILELKEEFKLLNLMKALSLQIGNLTNYSELSLTAEMPYLELKSNLNILEKTYICSLVKPFQSNKRLELVKNPKVYFYDFGFRNILIDDFSIERSDLGAMYENFIFSELVRHDLTPKFWRTKSKAEVDFVLEMNKEIIPIEIKANVSDESITRSFRSFVEKYSPKRGFICSANFEGEIQLSNSKIYFVPFLKLLKQLQA
jgi:predicted AAA+ superfamily ATPase